MPEAEAMNQVTLENIKLGHTASQHQPHTSIHQSRNLGSHSHHSRSRYSHSQAGSHLSSRTKCSHESTASERRVRMARRAVEVDETKRRAAVEEEIENLAMEKAQIEADVRKKMNCLKRKKAFMVLEAEQRMDSAEEALEQGGSVSLTTGLNLDEPTKDHESVKAKGKVNGLAGANINNQGSIINDSLVLHEGTITTQVAQWQVSSVSPSHGNDINKQSDVQPNVTTSILTPTFDKPPSFQESNAPFSLQVKPSLSNPEPRSFVSVITSQLQANSLYSKAKSSLAILSFPQDFRPNFDVTHMSALVSYPQPLGITVP